MKSDNKQGQANITLCNTWKSFFTSQFLSGQFYFGEGLTIFEKEGISNVAMADFCSNCSPDFYDIDLVNEALLLERGHSINILCEGCNIRAIYKDEMGRIYLGKLIEGEIQIISVLLEEL